MLHASFVRKIALGFVLAVMLAAPLTPAAFVSAATVVSSEQPDERMVGGVFVIGPRDGSQVSPHIWDSEYTSGVFIRQPWNGLEVAPFAYDFSTIDRAFQNAVEHDKFVTIALGAGENWTPYSVIRESGGQVLQFQSAHDAHAAEDDCGKFKELGNPTDPVYQTHYNAAMRAMLERIQSNQEWAKRLAYVKLSGANELTYENKLPKDAIEGCINNAQVWAEAGYTPSGLVDFYDKQAQVIQDVFPGMPMNFALIQAGWPWVNEAGDYRLPDGSSSGGKLTKSIAQTEMILEMGYENYPETFMVSHNGARGHQSLNHWATYAGELGLATGFQTVNEKKLNTTEHLRLTLARVWHESDAHYIEIYDLLLQLATESDGHLDAAWDPVLETLGEWDRLLQTRAPVRVR